MHVLMEGTACEEPKQARVSRAACCRVAMGFHLECEMWVGLFSPSPSSKRL